MTDDRIRGYLRSRADGQPPADLLDAISRAADATPRHRRSWFAAPLPAAAAVVLTAVAVVAAILISQGRDVGPDPSESPSPIGTPDVSVISSPSPGPTASTVTEEGDLTQAGTKLTIPARDAEGSWGTITIERLPDVGGLRTFARADLDEANPDPSTLYFVNDPEVFYLELSVEYRAEREPDPLRFGADDWVLQGGSETMTSMDEKFFALSRDFGPAAEDLVNDEFVGTLTFAVPRSLEDSELRLAYQPASHDDPAWIALVRGPGTAPETFVMAPPGPLTAAQEATVEALFSTPDTCTNPVAGYTVTFPDAWYTNTQIGSWPPCSWFSPTVYEVEDPEVIPGEISIVINYQPDSGPFGVPSAAVGGGSVQVGGRPSRWAEYVGVGGGFIDIGSFLYTYTVWMDGQEPHEGETGDTLIATSSWGLDDDPAAYRLATAVLDRIMASLVFDE